MLINVIGKVDHDSAHILKADGEVLRRRRFTARRRKARSAKRKKLGELLYRDLANCQTSKKKGSCVRVRVPAYWGATPIPAQKILRHQGASVRALGSPIENRLLGWSSPLLLVIF
jgi:hypothetical protein